MSDKLFREILEEQRKKGVTIPKESTPLPKGNKPTVGCLYGKTRKQLIAEQQRK